MLPRGLEGYAPILIKARLRNFVFVGRTLSPGQPNRGFFLRGDRRRKNLGLEGLRRYPTRRVTKTKHPENPGPGAAVLLLVARFCRACARQVASSIRMLFH